MITDDQYIAAARRLYTNPNEGNDNIEIDDKPLVSKNGDRGAFVAAWVWVDNEEIGP